MPGILFSFLHAIQCICSRRPDFEINKFFENSLNISETARQLFVHRNTLVYRLEKIQKQTGLDVRVFEDALTFKIALMVADHMKFIENRK